jgi:hypothetical protein
MALNLAMFSPAEDNKMKYLKVTNFYALKDTKKE